MNKEYNFKIGNKEIGQGNPVFIVAEMSANHNQDFDRAKELVKTACQCGADAVKLQTYTPDTLTLNSKEKPFQIKEGLWKGKILYDLYKQTYMPWEWQPELKKIAESYGVPLFSTAYDDTSIDFLEKMGVSAYKIASFELIDLELLKKVAQTRKPVIISRGMASFKELSEAISTLRENGASEIAVLHCISSYPAKPEEMNLVTIPDIKKKFNVVVGLSDHSLGISAAVASVALGASIVEKHFTLRRADGGPDAAFSLEPVELKELVKSIREVEKAIGKLSYSSGKKESENIIFRRSLWVIKLVKKGEKFTRENVGSFRPDNGLAIKFLPRILGRIAKRDIEANTPMSRDLIEE